MSKVPVSPGHVALVDKADHARVLAAGPWHLHRCHGVNYARRYDFRDGRQIGQLMHRFILGLWDPKTKIDHQNNDGLDNQRHNLRPASWSQNSANRRKQRRRTSSQYKGVYRKAWRKNYRWAAQITVNSEQMHLGYFKSEVDAARAYNAAAVKFFGAFARLNFLQEAA